MKTDQQPMKHQPVMQDAFFLDAEQALLWSMEVLRRRRLPKLTQLWREVLPEAEFVANAWGGEGADRTALLPTDADGRLGLALKVDSALADLAGEHAEAALLLRLWSLGDWADEARLASALAMQEKMRRQGMRIRIAYRYSYAQLGLLLGCDRKAAWRRVQEALALLSALLELRGLVQGLEVTPPYYNTDNLKKDVQSAEFKMYDKESS